MAHGFRFFSIWTVDLAYLLHEYSVNFSFFTVTLGANPEYSTEAFYKVSYYSCHCSLINVAYASSVYFSSHG